MKIFVSAPYSKGDPAVNAHNAIMAGNAIFDAGHIPFVTNVAHFWHMVTPRPYKDWMNLALAFLPACDALLRLPGESSGADAEVAEARRLGIPVFYDLAELLAWAKTSPTIKGEAEFSTMRDEYDFSNAERGRHVKQFGSAEAMDAFVSQVQTNTEEDKTVVSKDEARACASCAANECQDCYSPDFDCICKENGHAHGFKMI